MNQNSYTKEEQKFLDSLQMACVCSLCKKQLGYMETDTQKIIQKKCDCGGSGELRVGTVNKKP